MKTVILGNGFIASHLPYEKIPDRVDLSNIVTILNRYKPDCIVNTIGYGGMPNIDSCEIEKEKTVIANTIIPALLAIECEKLGIHMVHIGSGCVFNGVSPNYTLIFPEPNGQPIKSDIGWKETDLANPQSFYSNTKYAADLVMAQNQLLTNLRIRMPISPKNHPRNFVTKIRGYKRVIDEPNSVTFTADLVRCIDWVIKEHKIGTYHVVNPQPLTAAQVMREYQKYHPEHKFEVISTEELDKITAAKRSNCVLNTEKLNKAGFIMTPSKEALERCMAEYIENIERGLNGE